MDNNIDIKEFKNNLSKINKSGKVLLSDLEELYGIVEYIKLYKKRGFKINTILSIVNNNIYNTEQYLIQVIDQTKKMSICIQEKTNIININNNIKYSDENNITNLIQISITSNNISSNNNNEISNISGIHSPQIKENIDSDSTDISDLSSSSSSSKKEDKSKCCGCFKL